VEPATTSYLLSRLAMAGPANITKALSDILVRDKLKSR
jgi:hypothetical protein